MTAIRERRTIRKFKPDSIDTRLLISLLQDAAWAPNHCLREPWKLKLIQGEGRKKYGEEMLRSYERLGFTAKFDAQQIETYRKNLENFVMTVPVHLIVYMEKETDPAKFEEDFAAVCAFMQNFQLLAWEKGIGMVWASNPYIHDPVFAARFGIGENEKIVGVFHIGYPKKIPKPGKRTPIETKLDIIET